MLSVRTQDGTMQFLTRTEAAELAKAIAPDGGEGYSLVTPYPGLQVAFEELPASRLFNVAERLVDLVDYFDWCLLWVTQTEVWGGTENLHLYYTVRRAYGERTEIDQRPAQRFLRHELRDLVTFVQLGMLNGWDMVLLSSHDYGRVFVSHDGWAEVVHPNGTSLEPAREQLVSAKLECRTLRPAS